MPAKKTSVNLPQLPEEFTPPPDLLCCQRAARHFWLASKMHLSRVEELERENAELRRQQRPQNEPDADRRRLVLELIEARNEIARLKQSAQVASAAWLGYARKYQGAPLPTVTPASRRGALFPSERAIVVEHQTARGWQPFRTFGSMNAAHAFCSNMSMSGATFRIMIDGRPLVH